jgi:hypothetical protein
VISDNSHLVKAGLAEAVSLDGWEGVGQGRKSGEAEGSIPDKGIVMS